MDYNLMQTLFTSEPTSVCAKPLATRSPQIKPRCASLAIVFTDIVGSTRLVEKLGDSRAATVFATHDRIARNLIAMNSGFEIDKSDGFFVLFSRASDAARFAFAYHSALASITSSLRLQSRVGIHFGALLVQSNKPDDLARGACALQVEGLAKPIAARIMALAPPNGTVASWEAAREILADPRNPSVPFLSCHSIGLRHLAGVSRPVTLFRIRQRS